MAIFSKNRSGTIIIYHPEERNIKAALDFYNGWNKDMLTETFKWFRSMLRDHNTLYVEENMEIETNVINTLRQFPKSVMPAKAQIVEVLALITADLRNIRQFMETGAILWAPVLELLTRRRTISGFELQRIIGMYPLEEIGHNSWATNYGRIAQIGWLGFSIFMGSGSHSIRYSRKEGIDNICSDVQFYMPPFLLEQCKDAYPSAFPYDPVSAGELPYGARTISTQDISVRIFDYLNVQNETNGFDFGTSYKPKISELKIIETDGNAFNFSFCEKDPQFRYWRARLYSVCFNEYLVKLRHREPDYKEFLRAIPNDIILTPSFLYIQSLLPQLKGLQRTQIQESSYGVLCPAILQQLRAQGSKGEWVDVRKLYIDVLYSRRDDAYRMLFLFGSWTYRNLRAKFKRSDDPIAAEYFSRIFSESVFYGVLATLAATGLADLATLDNIADTPAFPAEAITHIRLTSYGLYAFRLTEDISISGDEPEGEFFEFDDERHIISVLKSGRPYTSLLDRLGERLTNRHYRITTDSLLKECYDASSLKKIANTFTTKILRGHLTPAWTDMIDELKKRNKAVTYFSRDSYIILKMDLDDAVLMKLLNEERESLKSCIPIPGGLLAVPVRQIQTVRNLLEPKGYYI